jgi:hypothetical protein
MVVEIPWPSHFAAIHAFDQVRLFVMLFLNVSLNMILSFETDAAVFAMESVRAMFRLHMAIEGFPEHFFAALITRDLLLPGGCS